MPPRSQEAEMALLGALLTDPHVMGEVIGLVSGPEPFSVEAHAAIFQAIQEVWDRSQSGDLVQIIDRLSNKQALDAVGGPQYLVQLVDSTPSTQAAPHYARIVAEKHRLRRLIEAAEQIVFEAYQAGDGGSEQTKEVLDAAEASIFKIAESSIADEPQVLTELLFQECERIERALAGERVTGISTGFHDLDKKTSGFHPGELIVIAGRPSMGKCLAHDSEIVLDDGSIVTIEEIVAARAGRIATLDEKLRLKSTDIADFVDDGLKPVFEVVTRLGRRVTTTLTHPFLTLAGWTPLARLQEGDHIAVPRRLPFFGSTPMRACEIKLLAYLIGDGGLTGTTPRFTNSNPEIIHDFMQAVEDFGGHVATPTERRPGLAPSWAISACPTHRHDHRADFGQRLRTLSAQRTLTGRALAAACGVTPASVSHWKSGLTAPDQPTFAALCTTLHVEPADLAPHGHASIRHNDPSPMTRWLTSMNLMVAGAVAKAIPPAVFRLDRPSLALFLSRLFATDGWATVLTSGQAQIGYASVSQRLASQVQHLLLRFGIIAKLRQRWVKYKDSRRPAFQLDITDRDSIRAFAADIGIFGKQHALDRAVAAASARRKQSNRDHIPGAIWDRIAAAKGPLPWSALADRIGATGGNLHVGRRALSRPRLARIADALNDRGLRDLADSDVYWDEIVSITPLGEQQVYDLTIPTTHNFIAQDICVHNTSLALNLAEQIALGGRAPFDPHRGEQPVPVAFFSLEMSKEAVSQRLISAAANIDHQRLRSGDLSIDEFERIKDACSTLHTAPIFVDDAPGLTILQLRARARRMVRQHKIKCIMVDYLQLLTAPGAGKESRQNEVAAISRGIKSLARELRVPVICLAQLNRGVENREGNRPRMSDLRESGSIEQDADAVMLLHREEYYHIGEPDWLDAHPEARGKAELILAKQRNGPTGVVEFAWDAAATRFKNFADSVVDVSAYEKTLRPPASLERPRHTQHAPAHAATHTSGHAHTQPQHADLDEFEGGMPITRAGTTRHDIPRAEPKPFSPGQHSGPVSNFRDGGGPIDDPAEGLSDEEPPF